MKLVSAARAPTTASGAPWLIVLGLCTLFGFLLGILAALLLEQLENHIRTPEQMRSLAPSLDVLAMIPQSDDMTNDETYIESIRSLRVALSSEEPDQQTNVIAVTSALAGEGKSTTSLWLARIMAASGAKVLLIDGDLRYAGLQKSAALNPFYSVADILLKRATFKEMMTKDKHIANLSLLIGKAAEPGDIDLLTRQKIDDFIANVASQYDVVIIDTPPSILASEAIWWLQEADRCLYLARWDHTPYDVARSELKRLKSCDVTIDGFVITRVDAREHAAYGYHDTLHHYLRHHATRKFKQAA